MKKHLKERDEADEICKLYDVLEAVAYALSSDKNSEEQLGIDGRGLHTRVKNVLLDTEYMCKSVPTVQGTINADGTVTLRLKRK